MGFRSGFATLVFFALASSATAQGEPTFGACPGGANMQLTALTIPQPVQVAPPPPPPVAPKPVAPKVQPKPKPQPKPKAKPQPKREPRPQPAPRPLPQPEREIPVKTARPPAVPRPSGNTGDRLDALESELTSMMGAMGGRPAPRPVVTRPVYTRPVYTPPVYTPPEPTYRPQREDHTVRDVVNILGAAGGLFGGGRRNRRPRGRTTPQQMPQTTPQTTPQSVPQSMPMPQHYETPVQRMPPIEQDIR